MPQIVNRTVLAARYDGSTASAEDCLAAVRQITANTATWSIEAHDGQQLWLREEQGGSAYTWPPVPRNYWLIVAPDFGILNRLPEAVFRADYRTVDDVAAAVLASSSVQSALTDASRSSGAFGLATIPTLIGGATTTVQVTIKPTLPDMSYTAAPFISGEVSLLAALSPTAVTKVSGSRVDVTIRNTGLLSLGGGKVLVHCS